MGSKVKTVKTLFVTVSGLAALVLLFLYNSASLPGAAASLALQPPPEPIIPMSPGPDLTVQSISLNPPDPMPGQPVTVTVVIKNIGSSAVTGGFYTRLYIDPPEQPPTPTTPDTSYVGWFLGLNPGATFSWSYTDYVFDTPGCGHAIYAWVDRDNHVAEDNETNNLSGISVCVGGSGDPYEPDDTCTAATILSTNGITQTHNFYPAGDQDWYQFTGIGGVEYIIRARNVGTNANVALSLFSRCDSVPPSFGGGQEIRVTLPISGTYYIRAVNENISATTQTSYTISIQASFDCSGYHEPNDTRETANEITADGTPQRHSFCAPGDEDWVKFNTQAGMIYTVQALSIGADAFPVVAGFDSSDPSTAVITNPLRFTSTTNGLYYVRVTNAISTSYGSTTNYSLTVHTEACTGDTFEPDNSRGSAQPIVVNASAQVHNACPAGDRDWTKFNATAGITYTLETVGLGSKSDTVLCLYDNIGTLIACDDEGGVNHGSRLTWQATAPGEYFIEIRQATDQFAGPETAYELSAVTGLCRTDIYEPDDTTNNASLLYADGSAQSRNFCPPEDRDWAKLNIPAAGAYTIQTSALGPGCDTVMGLYGTDGVTLLAQNDDYAPGLASQIVYNFPAAGNYYIEVRHFNPARYGRSTTYLLSAIAGTPTPSPTPRPGTPTPTPTPTPEPPSSGIQTLIVTNRERLTAIYGASRVNLLFNKLTAFANHPAVRGEILEVEGNGIIAAAYSAWSTDWTDVSRANQVASTIRSVVMEYLAAHPSVRYIVLVGDDRVIPSRRIRDRTNFPESQYTVISANTTVGAALANDYFLSDDYYADREPTTWQGEELYIPDWAIGRLVETPEQIAGMIDAFMVSDQLNLGKALVIGYDFVQDAATNICDLYGQDMGTANLDCTLIGDHWYGSQFRDKQLHANPPFKFQSINGHASHASQGAPLGSSVSARDVLSATANLNGAVIYSIGCHSGLNVPETSNLPLDLPEAFAWQGVNYVGNTGFGWGSRINTRFSERLMQIYTQELLKGSSTTIGQALVSAKQRYYQEADSFEERDEKVLQQVTLYGFPMYRLNSGAVLADENPFPSVTISSPFTITHQSLVSADTARRAPVLSNQSGKGTLSIHVGSSSQSNAAQISQAEGFNRISTSWGDYYQLDGHINTQVNSPIEPQLYVSLLPPANQQFRGIVFTGGSYYTTTIDPVIDVAVNEYVTTTYEPAFQSEGFYPPIPFSLQTSDTISRTDTTLTIVMGQYDSTSHMQRIYTDLQYDVYFSNLSDHTGPTITSVDGYYNLKTSRATFKVEARDPLTVTRVLVAYTLGAGSWYSYDLTYNSATHKWVGSVPGIRGASYFVQAVDSAGNATAVSRKGGYFELPEVDLATVEEHRIHLPLVTR